MFAAALLADAIQNMQELGWLTVLTTPVWNTGRLLSEDTQFGDLLHSLVGYAQAPSVLQLVVYLAYLTTVLLLLLNVVDRARAGSGVSR